MTATDRESQIPLSLDEVNADWLTRVLKESGELEQAQVTGFDTRVVGEGAGFMGQVVIMYLQVEPSADDQCASMVLKIPTATDNRHVGQTLGVYEREIRFYRELKPRLDIRTPRHIYSAMEDKSDPYKTIKALKALDRLPMWLIKAALPVLNKVSSRSTYRYALLIENLENYRVGDQVRGCTAEEAKVALDTMAKMHARFWDSPELGDFPWLLPMDLAPKPLQMLYLQGVEPFKKAHQSWLTSRDIEMLDWLKKHFFELMARLSPLSRTLIHGDFRLDNLCFDDENNQVILFDWQTLGIGACGIDLAYFLSALPDEGAVDELIGYYRERLAENGVILSREHLGWQYEMGLFGVLHRVVPAEFQDMLDLGEGRGNDLIATWLERVFKKIERLDPERLLGPIPD